MIYDFILNTKIRFFPATTKLNKNSKRARNKVSKVNQLHITMFALYISILNHKAKLLTYFMSCILHESLIL